MEVIPYTTEEVTFTLPPKDEFSEAEEVSFPKRYLRNKPLDDFFVIRIEDNAMFCDYCINDIVLVAKDTHFFTGSGTAVIEYKGKLLVRNIEITDDEIKIMSRMNAAYPTIVLTGAERDDFRLAGLVRVHIVKSNWGQEVFQQTAPLPE